MPDLTEDISNGEIMVIVIGIAVIGYMLYRAAHAVTDAVSSTGDVISSGVDAVKSGACTADTFMGTIWPTIQGVGVP